MSFLVLNEVEPLEVKELKQEDFNISDDVVLNEAYMAAEAHKIIRSNIQQILKPGVNLLDVVNQVENLTKTLLPGEKHSGIGFPCGISLNDVAAHYTLNPNDPSIFLKESDILKVDFGVHRNGRIMDSAFTVCFDEKYEDLLKCSKEAMEVGVKNIKIGMKVCELGSKISEVFNSYDCVPVIDLCGHSIGQYQIHSGTTIPPYNNHDKDEVKPGFCAVEVFASTGEGRITGKGACSHFTLKDKAVKLVKQKSRTGKKLAPHEVLLLNMVKEFSTLPFSLKHVNDLWPNSIQLFKFLEYGKCLNKYEPLVDRKGGMVAQFEHTVYLKENGKVVLTRGDDY